MKKTLIILNNIGSPDSTKVGDVRKYLQEFLMDPFVIQIPWFFRWLLVYGIISVFRAKKSAHKYQTIWEEKGSPLIVKTSSLQKKLQKVLPKTPQKTLTNFEVRLGMRYQNPSIAKALESFPEFETVYLIPLYPQYAESTTQSAIEKLKTEIINLTKNFSIDMKDKSLKVLKPFWNHPLFIQSWVNKIKKFDLTKYQVLLFSYHGLPESQLSKNNFCQFNSACCSKIENANNNCYRAQCFQTTGLIIDSLKKAGLLPEKLKIETTFQSRLGRTKWIEPYTDLTIENLACNNESKKILTLCPAFVTDCLETLEEIQIENKKVFLEKGGQVFDYIPSLNDDDEWVQNLSSIIQDSNSFQNITLVQKQD